MKIALFGASGMIGSRILAEALARGHAVAAIVRNPEEIGSREGVTAVRGDALDADSIAATARGADVAISAYSPGSGPQENLSKNARALLDGLPRAAVARVIVVGGAGSLEVAPGLLLADTADFPQAHRPRAWAQRDQLDVLRAERNPAVTWTFVSPAASIAPGTRTGSFRRGENALLIDRNGVSAISAEDFAVAVVDEAEHPEHLNRRFTVAY